MSTGYLWWCWNCMDLVPRDHILKTEDNGAATGYCKEEPIHE